jgi:hypothetical protein
MASPDQQKRTDLSSSRLLKNTFRRHSERSEVRFSIARFLCDESLFDQNVKKREIPHFADSVRNDEFEAFQQPAKGIAKL